jgi:2-polyprenyl-3-methyl-5-hydroxy-6-metoxy-1,4-benzoquinol methylase
MNFNNYKILSFCLCCNNQNTQFLDLGEQPLANNYHEQNIICEVYPLKLMYCSECFHCQLSHAVNPEALFKTYKYVSGTSQTGLDFFKKNAQFISNYKQKIGNVLDIASNDGSQLDFFKEIGWTTYGVDPATNLCPIAKNKGHNIICDFWNENVAKQLPIMDVITAQNVFAHTQYVDEFLQNCKIIMDDNTSLFIQTSQKNMDNKLDNTFSTKILPTSAADELYKEMPILTVETNNNDKQSDTLLSNNTTSNTSGASSGDSSIKKISFI